MKTTDHTYRFPSGSQQLDFAGKLVSLMGFESAIRVCRENQWDGTETSIRRMRKDLISH